MRLCFLLGLLAAAWSTIGPAAGEDKPAPPRLPFRGEPAKPLVVPAGVTVHKDIPYLPDAHPQHKLDLYLPKKAGKPLPLVMWIHGGGWATGDKKRIPAIFLVEHGYALASIDHRLSGEAIFPAQIQDTYAALAWLWGHAEDHGLDRNRLAVAGGSSGAHLASLAATAANAGMKAFGAPVGIRIRAVVDYFGPSDLIALRSHRGEGLEHDAPDALENRLIGADVLDRPDLARAASPTTYVDGEDPPFLILHGDRDPFLPFSQSRLLTSALKLSGVRAELVRVTGAGHGGARFQSPEMQQTVLRFLQETLAAH